MRTVKRLFVPQTSLFQWLVFFLIAMLFMHKVYSKDAKNRSYIQQTLGLPINDQETYDRVEVEVQKTNGFSEEPN